MGSLVSKLKIEYILVGIVVALTGFEFAYRASIYIQIGILLCIALYFVQQKKKLNNKFFLITIPFLIPLFFQTLQIGNFYPFIANGIAYFVQFLICYLVLEIVKDRLHITFVGFIYFLALFSFIFFPTQFFPIVEESIRNGIGSLLQPLGSENIPEGFKSKTLIFFTYMHGYGVDYRVIRNSGAFWEPGMFATFLNIALFVNLYINKVPILSKKNIVFIIAILTTLSTSGYLVLILIFLSKFVLIRERYKILLYLPVLVAFSYFTYTYVWKLDILSNKIQSNFQGDDQRKSRYGAMLYHFKELKESPLTGVVLPVSQKESKTGYEELINLVSPNGLSYVFFVWGIPIGIYYDLLFFRGIRLWLKQNKIKNKPVLFLFFFIMLLLAFSQDITVRYFYTMILFFAIVKTRPTVKYKRYNNPVYGTI